MTILHGMPLTENLPTREDCEEWFHWFEGRGIPAAIVRMQDDTFAVFRKGAVVNMVAKGKYEKREIREMESGRVLEVVAACNGYVNGEGKGIGWICRKHGLLAVPICAECMEGAWFPEVAKKETP